MRPASLVLLLFALAARPMRAIQFDTLPGPHPWAALGQTTALNVVVNRIDAWGRNRDWAKVGSRVWANNLRLGWDWDEDAFPTNVFAHPYHGGVYFNTGRANGLDFFQSIPIVLFGSWSWEYFAETERPSLNDFLMSSFGGITFGEILHRVGTTIRDNQARGRARTLRELTALPFDPVGGLNRLVRGQWSGVGPNPRDHDPAAFVLRLGLGARFAKGLVNDSVASMGTVVVDLLYGDQFAGKYQNPFDVFGARLIFSSQGGLNAFRASGRLYGRDLNDSTAHLRHALAVNQRYDYVKNPAQSVGGQSFEIGINSRLSLGSGFGIRTAFFVDGIVLGAIDAPGTGTGLRDYDFGPGGGFRGEVALDRHGARFLILHSRLEYIHSVSGAAADHIVNYSGIEFSIPIAHRFGIAAQTYLFDRDSRYADGSRNKRDYPEGRILVVWTKAAGKP